MNIERIKQIRDVFSYSRRFKKKTFVIHIDDALLDTDMVGSLLQDIHQLVESGIYIVLLAGIRTTTKRMFSQFGRSTQFLWDSAVVVEETDIELLQSVVFETTGKILAAFASMQQVAVVGNWASARSRGVVHNKDLLYSGKLDKIDRTAIQKLFENNVVPIFPPLGWSKRKKPYYLSSIELAAQVSIILGAAKLIYVQEESNEYLFEELALDKESELSNVPVEGGSIRVTVEGAKQILQNTIKSHKDETGHMLQSATQALDKGVERVHLLDGTIDGVLLLEIFFDQGIGVMLHSDEYKSIGPIAESDIETVYNIMLPHIRKGTLLFREPETIRKRMHDYVSYRVDGEIYGVAAYHKLDTHSVEIAAIAIRERYENFGVGRRLVQYLLKKAQSERYNNIFCLTRSIGDWFEELGFKQVDATQLPKIRYAQYISAGRNSRVYLYKN
ncbi:amino-acid acetyltransferase-like [Ylistrum balloti]|uniref:amino-acid acetyltransferase-like n=1 Tax=Ylistrum balloti TaxID=509963 RepID=UPI002905F257|nr:amino-acid acetyltransferase-like [Ylistrum balloti]